MQNLRYSCFLILLPVSNCYYCYCDFCYLEVVLLSLEFVFLIWIVVNSTFSIKRVWANQLISYTPEILRKPMVDMVDVVSWKIGSENCLRYLRRGARLWIMKFWNLQLFRETIFEFQQKFSYSYFPKKVHKGLFYINKIYLVDNWYFKDYNLKETFNLFFCRIDEIFFLLDYFHIAPTSVMKK